MCFDARFMALADPKWGTRDAPPRLGQIYFIFMQYLGENGQNNLWDLHSLRKSWIRHCMGSGNLSPRKRRCVFGEGQNVGIIFLG